MKRLIFRLFVLLMCCLMTVSCMKNEFNEYQEEQEKEQIEKNVKEVFGTEFDKNHDWKTTFNGVAVIDGIPENVKKIQIIALIQEEDSNTSMFILNEEEVSGSTMSLSYDSPKENLGLFLGLYMKDGNFTVIEMTSDEMSLSEKSLTRNLPEGITLPSESLLTIANVQDSDASERGWIPGEKLYQMGDYWHQKISVGDYNDAYKTIFRAIIFSYFKNGRAYNNLPLVQESGLYNSNAYPFTTGDDPILISPVYKNDGGYKEIENSDLYYYYFKDEDLGEDPVAYLKSLPKYKAIQFNECIKGDNVIQKHATYALVYWGDGVPGIGTTGTFTFPKGYKIGFMVRAMTTAEGGKKQGELYGDGRLNNYINSYQKCNFKSSKLGVDGPRQAWITVNSKNFICFESGTDADFNDIILEVEGGIDPPIYIPEIEVNSYTFCFEDTELGDYDMNDIVLKAKRLNSTTVQYSLVACGAYDEVFVMNVSGRQINEGNEVHVLFEAPQTKTYVNTERGGYTHDPIVDEITVDKKFSFLDEDTQPFLYDKTSNKYVYISRVGEDPHGIMIPNDFRWPLEKVKIKDAYPQFNSWGQSRVTSTDWYKNLNLDLVY